MPQIKFVKISHILNPTSIGLGEYVINPFLGCEYGCLYCYVKTNKVTSKKIEPWGSFVEIRVNAPRLLEKEILKKRPKVVLMGSTTDCFQPIDKSYKITASCLEILNRYGVYYNILTRSPNILEYLGLLSQGFCKTIYFTINNLPERIKTKLENKSPDYLSRIEAIKRLKDAGLNVIPYFSPILPGVSNPKDIFTTLPDFKRIEFEGLNFMSTNIKAINEVIVESYPSLGHLYQRLSSEESLYNIYWEKIKNQIKTEAKKNNKEFSIYIHKLSSFFTNNYFYSSTYEQI